MTKKTAARIAMHNSSAGAHKRTSGFSNFAATVHPYLVGPASPAKEGGAE